MSEEEKQPSEEGAEQAPDEEPQEPVEPAAEDSAAEPDAAAEEGPDEEPAAEEPAEEPAAEEPAEDAAEEPAEERAAEEPAAEEAPAADAPAAQPEEPAEELTPKQRRKLERSRATGPAGPSLSAEERAARRLEARRAKAAARSRRRARARSTGGERRQGTPPATREVAARKVRLGTVVSTKADKTITVRIEIARRHPAYEKVVRRSNTLHAHDEQNQASEGDVVRVVETRPLSRTKRWRLVEVVERAR